MRLFGYTLAALILLSDCGYWSCSYNDDYHHHHHTEDVTVEITGPTGLAFDAHFQDEHNTQNVSGQTPYTADFNYQESFFQAIVDKNSSGQEAICVDLRSHDDTRSICSTVPHARLAVTIYF